MWFKYQKEKPKVDWGLIVACDGAPNFPMNRHWCDEVIVRQTVSRLVRSGTNMRTGRQF